MDFEKVSSHDFMIKTFKRYDLQHRAECHKPEPKQNQVRLNIIKTGLWWLTIITVGFCAGLLVTWFRSS